MGLKYKFENHIDSPERTLEHRTVIKRKHFLYSLYRDWYQIFKDELVNLPEGKILEIGSGGGFLKEIIPEIITSDILPLPEMDLQMSADKMPFEDDSIAAIFMIDTFHHLSNPELFLMEARRVLMNNGKIIMIEPASSIWGKFIYNFFHQEPFLPGGGWDLPDTGPLSAANTALPWIVFFRDSEIFLKQFPEFNNFEINYHTPMLYLLSGGLTFKQLVPDFTYPFFNKTDQILSRFSKELSLFMTIKLRCTKSFKT
jgi:SAM-dependent methyltransferase